MGTAHQLLRLARLPFRHARLPLLSIATASLPTQDAATLFIPLIARRVAAPEPDLAAARLWDRRQAPAGSESPD